MSDSPQTPAPKLDLRVEAAIRHVVLDELERFAMAAAAGKAEEFVPMLSDFVAGLNGTSLVQPSKQAAE